MIVANNQLILEPIWAQTLWQSDKVGPLVQAALLPVLRKALRLPRLEYVSVQNQGDFLIEVPAERKDVPKVLLLAPTCLMHPPRAPRRLFFLATNFPAADIC